jgi:hypothetical protein
MGESTTCGGVEHCKGLVSVEHSSGMNVGG